MVVPPINNKMQRSGLKIKTLITKKLKMLVIKRKYILISMLVRHHNPARQI
jgi:hypothetical protein